MLTVNPKPEGPLRNIIGGFRLVGTSRQGEFNALHDPGDFICNPLLLDSKTTRVRYTLILIYSTVNEPPHWSRLDYYYFSIIVLHTRRYHQRQSSGRKTFDDGSCPLTAEGIARGIFQYAGT